MKQLIVYRGRNSWMAEFKGEEAATITSLFGTNHLPMPFTLQATAPQVLEAVKNQKANVGYEIFLETPTGREQVR